MPTFRLTADDGTPLAGATPVFLKYCDRLGAARLAPTINDHGQGLYSFNPTPSDVADGVGYLIDCGAGSNPRRGGGFVGNAHVFFPGYDAAGDFTPLLTPAISLYVSNSLAPIIPIPNIASLGGGLYAFTPAASDRIVGARFAIDMGAGTEPNRYPSGSLGEGIAPFDPGPPVPPGPIDFSAGANTSTPVKRALYFDPKTLSFPRENGAMIHLTGRASISQAVRIRLATIRGEFYLAVNRGLPYFEQILVKAPDLKAIEQTIRAEIESVPGVKTVKNMRLTFDRPARKLTLKWIADSDFGEIEETSILGV